MNNLMYITTKEEFEKEWNNNNTDFWCEFRCGSTLRCQNDPEAARTSQTQPKIRSFTGCPASTVAARSKPGPDRLRREAPGPVWAPQP